MPTPPMLRADRPDRRNGPPLARRRCGRVAGVVVWIAAGTVLAGLPGCLSHERPDAGKAPEGPVRVPGSTRPSKGGGGSGDAPASPTAGVIAVATSGIYHREGCTVLAESAAESRVPFATPWLALDAGHTPCGHCRPGP